MGEALRVVGAVAAVRFGQALQASEYFLEGTVGAARVRTVRA